MNKTRFIRVLVLTSLILAGAAQPMLGQTFLQQIFPNNPPIFEVTVEESAMYSFTAMWNRQDTDLVFALVCDDGSGPMDWGRSIPIQDRTLRFDAGMLSGYDCLAGLGSPNIAAFALNLQVYDQGNLAESMGVQLRPVTAEKRADLQTAAMIRRLEEMLADLVK